MRLALALLLLVPAVAQAQSASVREGQRLFDEAEFEQAIEVLERGLASETLTRAEVALALDRLAIAHHALGHASEVTRALGWLVVVDREHAFGPDAPPELSELAARAREAPRPELTIAVVDQERDRVTIEASFDGPDDLRAISLRCRTLGEPDRELREGRPRMTVARTASCDAIAIGPGAFPVTTAHRDGAPVEAVAAAPVGGLGDEVWIGLGVGGGALLVGVVVLAAVLSQPANGPVQLSGPAIVGW